MITIKNQGYISLHVTEINDLHCTHHVILCCISHQLMLYFTLFHVIFYTFYCTHYMHHTHITHIVHFAFHEQHAFHTLHHIARHFMYHFMSFHHENSLYSHSCHLALKREEKWSKCQALQ